METGSGGGSGGAVCVPQSMTTVEVSAWKKFRRKTRKWKKWKIRIIWAEQISTEGTTDKNGKERKKKEERKGLFDRIGRRAAQETALPAHPKGCDCGEVDGKYTESRKQNPFKGWSFISTLEGALAVFGWQLQVAYSDFECRFQYKFMVSNFNYP